MDDMRFWQSADDVFSSVAGWGRAFGGRIVDGPDPERIQVLRITEDYLSLHGVAPFLGRDFSREDTQMGAPLVALLGYGYWQSRYGGRTDVMGEAIRLDDGVASIVGVLPASFNAGTPMFRPLRIPPDESPRRGTGRVSVYGRLQPGVTIEEASARLSTGMSPGESALEARAIVVSRLESTTARYRTTVNVLVAAVGMILLIACVNVAGLLLARGAVRRPELATRASLGAGSVRLIRQLLTESVVLAVVGGVVGVLLAWAMLDIIVANVPMSIPTDSPVGINLRVLVGTTVLLLPTALLFGLVPAIRLARVNLVSALAHGERQSVSSSLSRRGGQGLIAAEVALATVLVVGAGLMIRTYTRLSSVDLGFDPDGLITMEVLPLSSDTTVQKTYYVALLEQLRGTPGIMSAGAIDNFSLGDRTSITGVAVGGVSSPVTIFGVLPGFFETLGVELRDGRLPTNEDYAAGVQGAVINEAAARDLFPEGPAVGRQFESSGQSEGWTVLGVVADIRHGGPLGDTRFTSQVYLPFEPSEFSLTQAMTVVLRPSAPNMDLDGQLRSAAQSIGQRVLIERTRTASDWFDDRVMTPRRRTVMLSLLGGLGLLLALVGVFGMTAYAVAGRISEIGVRMAFGAAPRQVVRMIVRDSAAPILIGTLVGLGGAVAGTRIIRSFLFETEPTDAATLAVVALMLVATGSLAALIPALRAARIDPAATLRTN
jgi:predicted permease